MQYTNHSNSERTAFEHELSNFLHLWISDRAQNLVSFEWNPIARTTEYTSYSYKERTAFEPELSNFLPLFISDRAQNLGIIIIWWEESFGEFWVKSNH